MFYMIVRTLGRVKSNGKSRLEGSGEAERGSYWVRKIPRQTQQVSAWEKFAATRPRAAASPLTSSVCSMPAPQARDISGTEWTGRSSHHLRRPIARLGNATALW